MKKLCVLFVVFLGLVVFTGAEEEEVDFLLFRPDSGDKFVNEDREKIHLDDLAKQLKAKNPGAGEIHVYGFAAEFQNNTDDSELSINRAAFVINELVKRGVPKGWFSGPQGYGATGAFGSNTNEEGRINNRRVVIMLEGEELIPEIKKADDAPKAESAPEKSPCKAACIFPWILSALLGLILLGLLLSKRKEKHETVDLDELIRMRAYELYLARGGRDENAQEDWHTAKNEICARYEADDYKTALVNGHWQASK
ncbi:MAG: OmpA family protein [Treponema sp.]|jgi:hypothetical protein|nr:OmpA family protein [Treponema sp.]